ncbi:hypothetical protein DFJ73DRAFT_159288 [Zopfochytrium polystomum]|nr:hypothetical protein DFJ73DRAFT_159288 [Zopfochytrium polystomum]
MPRTRSATRAAAVGEADVNSQPTSERGRGRGRGGGRGRGRGNGNPRDSASTPVSQSTPGSPTQDPVDELVSPGPVTTPAPTLRKGRRPVASVTTRSVNGKGKAPEVLPNGDDHSSDDDFEPIPPPSRSSVARKLSTEVPSTSKPSNGKRKAAESDSKDSEASDEYFPSSEVNDDDDDDSEYKPDSDDEALASKRPRKSAVIVKMLDRAAANSEQHSVAGPSQPQAKEEESEGSNELSEVGELSNSEEEGEAPGRRRRQPRGTRPKKPKTIPMAVWLRAPVIPFSVP